MDGTHLINSTVGATLPAGGIADRSIYHKGGRTGFLLIHGLGGTPIELRFVAQGLARSGFTVYCCQLAGHCGTPNELRMSSAEQWCESVSVALDRLSATCDTVIAGGLSMGAILALDVTLKRPDRVHGLALFAPTIKLDGWSMPWHSRILSFVRPTRWRSKIYLKEHPPYGIKDERIRAFIVNSMVGGDSSTAGVFSTPLHSLAEFNGLALKVKRRLGEIKLPTLILHPREDDMASLNNSIFIQRKLGGLVELVVLDDSYHIITLDRQRHLVVDRTVAFAQGLELQRANAASRRNQRA
jgi:carboxylesterase